MWSCFLHPPKVAFLSSSVSLRREYTWKLNWKEILLHCFENYPGGHYSHRQSRNRMMNTFITANITPTCKSLENKSMLVHTKKTFLLSSFWPETDYTSAPIWKKSLLICSESYQGISYSNTGRVDRGWWTLCLWLTWTLYVRDSLENKSMLFTHFYFM